MTPQNGLRIGHRVEIVRRRRGVSRTELARRLRVDRSTVTKWATIGSPPRNLDAVARALDASVAEIMLAEPPRAAR